MNAYEILGVAPDATEEQIKAAYRALAAKYSGEEYAQSPMKEEAEAKMNEINAAFDEAMSRLRVGESSSQAGQQNPGAGQPGQGQTPPRYTTGPQNGAGGKWAAIRQLINAGRVDEALAELNAIPGGASQAEWNFLMGSAFYYKGWLNEAYQYFSTACRLAPGNREYEAALHNLQAGQNGQMPGNPYGSYGAPGGQAMTCSCCDICAAMYCMDACCTCMRGC